MNVVVFKKQPEYRCLVNKLLHYSTIRNKANEANKLMT